MPSSRRQPKPAPQEPAAQPVQPVSELRLVGHTVAKTKQECFDGFTKHYQGVEALLGKATVKMTAAGDYLRDYQTEVIKVSSRRKAIDQFKEECPAAKDISVRKLYICFQLSFGRDILVKHGKTEASVEEALHWIGQGDARYTFEEKKLQKQQKKQHDKDVAAAAAAAAGTSGQAPPTVNGAPHAPIDAVVVPEEPEPDLGPVEEDALSLLIHQLTVRVEAMYAARRTTPPKVREISVKKKQKRITVNLEPDTIYVILPE